MKYKFSILSIILILVCSWSVFAENTENRYYMGNTVNTGKDNGYSGSKAIEEKDVHWNWKIGDFYISGFSQVAEGKTPVFLKTVGDEVTLNFELKQNISKLNNDASLIICEDTNGYDKYFQIEKTNFGKGVLILRHTDSQNYRHEPAIYTNYLSAKKSSKANTNVIFLEEGDYEVALNYEIKSSPINLFGLSVFPTYENYRIFFKFSVRNGNCMVFPYDVKTKSELVNSSFTENGFYLDLAKSKYLDIDIKKEILTDGVDGLVEDTRFNKPAKDGEEFTDEGIYTITASNKYTGQQTVKKIYVGTNKVLQAHTVTGLPISEISNQISLGAEISYDGSIIYPEAVNVSSKQGETKGNTGNDGIFIIIFIVIIAVVCGVIVFIKSKKGTHIDGGADK